MTAALPPFARRPLHGLAVWIPALAYSALIVALSSRSDLAPPTIRGVRVSDKLLHAAEYAVFAALWFRATASRGVSRRMIVRLLAAGALFAISDEIHQSFVPNRQADIADFLADIVGILIGAALSLAVRQYGGRSGRASAPS